jgi:hypothetical protein
MELAEAGHAGLVRAVMLKISQKVPLHISNLK